MKNSHIAIIGAGNMGASLLGGLIADGLPPHQLWVTDPDTTKLSQLKNQFAIHTTTNNEEAIKNADVILLAVKPQIMADVAQSMQETIQKQKPLIISIAAGITEKNLQHWLGDNIAIVRCMPNTPALLRCGASALHANHNVRVEQRNLAETILRAVGTTVWLDEEHLMDAVTALSGSGPAYFFLMIEALQSAAEKLGLPAETARLLTLQTAYGSARMALESPEGADVLRQRVTSKGGTTEAAIAKLEEKNIREIFTQALQAAKNRSEELAKG